jgi:hypothetical protein
MFRIEITLISYVMIVVELGNVIFGYMRMRQNGGSENF